MSLSLKAIACAILLGCFPLNKHKPRSNRTEIIMERAIDIVFLSYFVLHIPIFIFIDSQAVGPRWMYPKQILELVEWYIDYFRDPMMANPQAWFQSFIYCEGLFQLPFFFVASYVFWKGVSKCKWIRIPAIVYSSHLVTVCFAILYHINMNDFSKSEYPGPITPWERIRLSLIYLPFFAVPLLLLCDALFSSVYVEKLKQS